MPGSESHGPARKISRSMTDSNWSASAYRLWQFQRSYAADYIGFTILLVIFILLEAFAVPFHRLFYLKDIRISYPHSWDERVTVPMLFGIGGAIPFFTILATLALTRAPWVKSHITLLGLLHSLILTLVLTDILKNAIGRPRPDLLARCQPVPGTPGDFLVSVKICTETRPRYLHDGWRSFPSGHSSFAFAGLGYLALFLGGQVGAFRPRADLIRQLLVLAPVLGAALVAISRLEDYRHDVFDVVAGSGLGATVAWVTYRRHYPSLGVRGCETPFCAVEGLGMGFVKVRDEEEMVGAMDEEEERFAGAGGIQ